MHYSNNGSSPGKQINQNSKKKAIAIGDCCISRKNFTKRES